ncbi:metallophosphoesterase [Liquorilactobacillus sicerae]|uniref:metallophosphoesterase n=1 Tax=Liquorilactobacillus sicerae TaxID=1416943 RepID=UPI002480BD2C|nr:metallophosphoesterase [Liquorilactobacillus sicerae]
MNKLQPKRFLVVSDNHSDREILTKIAEKYQNQVDLMIHCGDSRLKKSDPLCRRYQVVEGNCDFPGNFVNEQLLTTSVGQVFFTHGHHYYVNFGMKELIATAQKNQATFCFFGHTHQLKVEYQQGCLFLNPGSISFPRGKFSQIGGTFAIVTVTVAQIVVNFYDRKFSIINELTQKFKR